MTQQPTASTTGSSTRLLGTAPTPHDPGAREEHLARQLERAKAELAAAKAAAAAAGSTSARRSVFRHRPGRKEPVASPAQPTTTPASLNISGTASSSKKKSRPSRFKRAGHWLAKRKRMVDRYYRARYEQLEVFRGPAVRPEFAHWYDLLKPRLIVFLLIYGLNVLFVIVFFGSEAPIWCFVPRPGLLERRMRAVRTIRAQQFLKTKFVAVFSLKGGIGKTTLTLLQAMMYRLVYTTMPTLVEDCNLDSGTLGMRIKQNSHYTMREAVAGRESIKSLSILQTFCSYLRSGLLVMVMGDWKLENTNQLEQLHDKFKEYLGLVFSDLGTSTISPSNEVALADANQVIIPTTPARDSIAQAAKTLNELLNGENEHNRELAHTAIIAVNRWWPFWWLFSRPSKVRTIFLDSLAEHSGFTTKLTKKYESLMGVVTIRPTQPTDEFIQDQERRRLLAHKRATQMARRVLLRDPKNELKRVRFTLVGSSLWLVLGLRVNHRLVPWRVRVQIQEINAMTALNLSDNAALWSNPAGSVPAA